jgi:hypothetical protein
MKQYARVVIVLCLVVIALTATGCERKCDCITELGNPDGGQGTCGPNMQCKPGGCKGEGFYDGTCSPELVQT